MNVLRSAMRAGSSLGVKQLLQGAAAAAGEAAAGGALRWVAHNAAAAVAAATRPALQRPIVQLMQPSEHSSAYSGPAVAFYVNCIHAVNSSGLEGRPQAAAGVAAAAARVGISLSRLPQPGLPLAMGEVGLGDGVLRADSVRRKRKSKMNKHKHRKRLKREGRKSK